MKFIDKHGAYFIADGQFGSTGKGLLASYLAEHYGDLVDICITNAGPNSGHTSYFGDRKVVLKQLPTFAVMDRLARPTAEKMPIYISPGAIINPDILNREVAEYDVKVFLSDTAALIDPADVVAEGSGSVAAVAGTRQGVGAALARKVLRDPTAIVRSYKGKWHPNITVVEHYSMDLEGFTALVEVSQGFSLGLNSHFYPKVTSRECSVAQACADARIAPQMVQGVAMAIRTFPIRVGDYEGHSSGSCHEDQHEIAWDVIGVEPELTTVTKRPRRVFTFSIEQYSHALLANRPSLVFVNFMNYIHDLDDRRRFAQSLRDVARSDLRYEPEFLYGYGPRNEDVKEEVT